MPRYFYIFLMSCVIFLGCASEKWDHLVEFDDVYVTRQDRQVEEQRQEYLEQYKKEHPEEAQPKKKERKKLNPRVKRALVWIGGFLGQIALDVALYFLLTL